MGGHDMALDALLECIRRHPETPGWGMGRWEAALDRDVAGWRAIVAAPDFWPALERARPRSDYDDLTRVLVRCAGDDLAWRWRRSDDTHQRRAAEEWLRRNDSEA